MSRVGRFQVKDRVTLSDEARRRNINPRAPRTRQGTVAETTVRAGLEVVWIRWDGRQSAEGYHESYLDIVERPR